MVITNVTAKIKSTCSISGYMTLNLNVTNLSSAFTSSGNSTGALKYVIASYNPSTYSTISTNALNGKSFDIIDTGSITSTGTIKLRDLDLLSTTRTKAYLVIFYIDGDMANNDAGSNSTNFKSNLEAIVTQTSISTEVKEKTKAAEFITSLYANNEKSTILNDNITYNQAPLVSLMNDRKGSMSTGIDAGNIRYYGANPNNYIYFNCSDYNNQTSSTCETWRIIGVFDGKVKIMKNESIGEYSWDSSASDENNGNGVNEWSQADLMKLLNGGYESESVGGSLYWNAKSGNCYYGRYNETDSCNFTSKGFKGLKNDTTRNLIAETTYYTRGYSGGGIYVGAMYDKERVSGTVITGVTPTRTLTWTGKVAVPYPSDYGYAADLSLCQQVLFNYDDETCTANNWMKSIFGGNRSWLLTPNTDHSYAVWTVNLYGSVLTGPGSSAYSNMSVVPVLSLESELGIRSGTGESSSPYQLAV